MDRWTGILKVPVYPKGTAQCRVAASLCISPHSKQLTAPSANAIFFNGDRVDGTGNPTIERLADIQKIADILVFKFGVSVNAWVIEASTFNGPFAIYKEFIPSVNKWGEPQSYKGSGFPASTSIITLLSKFLERAEIAADKKCHQFKLSAPCPTVPDTFIVGFSKGGTIVNQLVTELGFSNMDPCTKLLDEGLCKMQGNLIIPSSIESFLDSVREIHYVDAGLNSSGAYLTDDSVIKSVHERVMQRDRGIRFMLHGTPRQWCDIRRPWICREKEKLVQLLESEAQKTGGKLQVRERLYFADESPSLQMHFEIIEKFDAS